MSKPDAASADGGSQAADAVTVVSPESGSEASCADGTGEPSYAAAMAELEQILDELEGENPDVDLLAERVERAANLIDICRRRIASASISVERIVATLDSDVPQ